MPSAISIFRQKILGPGKSEHSGRGFFIVDTELSHDELVQRMKDFAAKRPEMVEYLRQDDKGFWTLSLKPEYNKRPGGAADPRYYRSLVVGRTGWGGAIVPM